MEKKAYSPKEVLDLASRGRIPPALLAGWSRVHKKKPLVIAGLELFPIWLSALIIGLWVAAALGSRILFDQPIERIHLKLPAYAYLTWLSLVLWYGTGALLFKRRGGFGHTLGTFLFLLDCDPEVLNDFGYWSKEALREQVDSRLFHFRVIVISESESQEQELAPLNEQERKESIAREKSARNSLETLASLAAGFGLLSEVSFTAFDEEFVKQNDEFGWRWVR